MKLISILLVNLVFSTLSFAEVIYINLTDQDQGKLTEIMSHLNAVYKTKEIIQEQQTLITKYTYNFLTEEDAFFIKCSELFIASFSPVGTQANCTVGFNIDKSYHGEVEVYDGFMSNFVGMKISNSQIASVLYKALGKEINSTVYFNTKEQILFTHPVSGKVFSSYRLRIDCNRNDGYSCTATAIK